MLRIGNGGELYKKEFEEFCKRIGILGRGNGDYMLPD